MSRCRAFIFGLAASAFTFPGLAAAAAQAVCRPKLTVSNVQFSEMLPPARERKWTATVTVDASRCAAHASGDFSLAITRSKEMGSDVDFRERFTWSTPPIEIGVDFWADEAVEQYWIEDVTPCTCAD